MKKIVMITTVPLSLTTLVKGQAKYLSNFFDVKLITSSSQLSEEISLYEGVELKEIDMTRQITPLQDLKALYKIYIYLLKEKPEIVYTFTPKAGLLGMIASFFARVPIRIHNVVGMPLIEATGTKLKILKLVERVTYLFSTKLLCNSFGLKKYINENLTSKTIQVVGQGSVNGVDTEFFKNTFTKEQQVETRDELGILEEDFVVTFVGRIVKDKGINELVESFILLSEEYDNLKLLLVGDYEENLNPIEIKNKEIIDKSEKIISVGFQKDIRKFLAITDLFVLPSYREGLPNSLIEAGSYGIPLLSTNINGCNEIIIDKVTGVLVEKKDVESLKNGIEILLKDTTLYKKIKDEVRASMMQRYNQDYFLNELRSEFEKSL